MYQVFRKNWDKTKYFIISAVLLSFFLLLTVVYKSDIKISDKTEFIENSFNASKDLKTFKKFILKNIDIFIPNCVEIYIT